MTTAIDKAIGPVAAQMINQFGTTVVLRGSDVSTYNAETGIMAKSDQEAERKVLIGRNTSVLGQSSSSSSTGPKPHMLGTLGFAAQRSSMIVTMAAHKEEFSPEAGYSVLLSGKTYSVTSVTPSYSGDDIATYDLVLAL